MPEKESDVPPRPPAASPPDSAHTRSLTGPDAKAADLIRAVTEPVPERVGAYRILGVLGKGGMGVVYLAEQEQPVHRRVALKVIQPEIDSHEVLARFESERQALAMLDHPNIAKVFDAGTTERGRPYFVMEYVDGVPFREYCDRERLGLRERLELFVPVCEAIHHAHLKGIIHRDVKPSNVLIARVDGRPLPKLIDFGLAKATEMRLTDRTLATRFGQILGTPSYMSPEQAGLTEAGIDSATDIYSLGVMLYELLTGTLPFDTEKLMEKGYGELQRVIRETDPPKPSSRILELGESRGPVSDRRSLDPGALSRALRGDLDWITMRAMEKERSHRYASSALLGEDIQRYLRHEPILAGPPSISYRLGKLVRRKPIHAALAGVLLILLPAGGWLGLRVLNQQRRLTGVRITELERRLSRGDRDPSTLLSLADQLLALDPENVKGLDYRAKGHFNRALHEPADSAAGKEDRRASLEAMDQLIARQPDRSWPFKQKAYFLERYGEKEEAERVRRAAPTAAHPDPDDYYFEARSILDREPGAGREELRRAEQLLDQTILITEREDAIEARAYVRSRLGDDDGALSDYRHLARMLPTEAYPHFQMGKVLADQENYQEADDQLRRALELAPADSKWPADQTWEIQNRRAHNFIGWAELRSERGDREEALRRASDAEAAARAGLENAPKEPKLHINLATSLKDQWQFSPGSGREKVDEAVREFERVVSLAGESGRPQDRSEADLAIAGICDAYLQLGEAGKAMPSCRNATERAPKSAVAFYNLAGALALSGNREEALAALEKDFELGDRDYKFLSGDAWFRSLRTDSRFKSLVDRMRKKAEEEKRK